MHVALINPPPASEIEKHWARFLVLGLAYVASALRAANHRVTLLDGKLDELTIDQICRRATTPDVDLVGITCMTVEFPIAADIAHRIKARSDVPIAVGGAHINAVKSAALEECSAIDFACDGEGEHLIVDLARVLATQGSLESVDGLILRSGDRVVATKPRPYPKDYDSLPFPAWDLFRPTQQIPILTHRGCPFQCTFCGHNSGFRPRYRSPDNVLLEIEHLIERYAPKVIRFEDETFGLNMPRTKQILRGILARDVHRKARFSAQTRVDRLDEEFVELLREANFETLELGVESGNAGILERVKKGITLEQVERAVRLAKGAGLRVWCKFILGHPGETIDTVRDTLRFIVKLNPDRLSVSLMTPYPGTPIHEMALRGEGGYRLLGSTWDKFDKYSSGVLELEGVSLGQLKRYQLACYLMLYLRNWRITDLVRLSWAYRSMLTELVSGAWNRTVSEAYARILRRVGVASVGPRRACNREFLADRRTDLAASRCGRSLLCSALSRAEQPAIGSSCSARAG